MSIDLTDLEMFTDGFPHAAFAHLRREHPVYFHEPTAHTPDGEGFWVLSRHRDIVAAARHPLLSSERHPDRPGGGTMIEDLPTTFATGVLMNMMDDPRHRQVRQLVSPVFGRRAIGAVEPELVRITRSVVASAVRRGVCDFVADVATEMPLRAIAGLLEVPQQDRHRLFEAMHAALDYTDRDLGETSERSQQGQADLMAYGAQLMGSRRNSPGHDVLSTVARGELADGDPLSELEQLMVFSVLLVAGAETTRNALSCGLLAFVSDQEAWQALRADRTLLPGAIEEILRWSSPATYNRRTALADLEIGGRTVREGAKVTLWWPSANRDEEVFSDPEAFDIRRAPNPHLTFGQGAHFCLGAPLARRELHVALSELLDRVERVELTGEPVWGRSNKHTGLRHLPVRLVPARVDAAAGARRPA